MHDQGRAVRRRRSTTVLAAFTVALGGLALADPVSAAATRPGGDPASPVLGSPRQSAPEVEVFGEATLPEPLRYSARKAAAPLTETFELHSRPSASRTIYLDFNGYDLPASSPWVDDVAPGWQPAYSLDADDSTFSDTERTVIQQVWARVAEDFAPFDLDVTTEEPPPSRLRRLSTADQEYGMPVAIVGNDSWPSGIAYLDVFSDVDNSYYFPAWTFLSDISDDPAIIADIVSHEAGHTLSLEHDSGDDGEYHWGAGVWSPIMGQGDRALTQWSKGEYDGAYNGSPGDPLQDDLALIADRAPKRADDHADTTTGATWLGAGQTLGGSGVVTDRGDQDVFELQRGSCAEQTTVSVSPAQHGPSLDVRLRVLDANGATLVSSAPTTGTTTQNGILVPTGMGASATIPSTSAGTYYVEVDGGGQGDATAEGWSDYASLGTYTVTANGCAGDTGRAGQVENLRATLTSSSQGVVSWEPPTSNGGSSVTGYTVRVDGVQVGTPTTPTYNLSGMSIGNHTVTVSATNASGAGPVASLAFRTHDSEVPSNATKPGVPRDVQAFPGVRKVPGKDIIVFWSPPRSDGGTPVKRYRLKAYKMVDGRVAKTITAYDDELMGALWTVGRGKWRVKVQAQNEIGWGKLSAASRTVKAL
jgi:hypothetical protein